MAAYETIIGLEIHAELNTKSKIFCPCSTKFGSKPNTNTCPVCTGLPGSLPVLNKEVIKLAIKAGAALNCDINLINKTDRKNYFYPDLPKAYQISQFDMPICSHGYVNIVVDNKERNINLTRIHIEEDAGKLVHLESEELTLIDYNRAGVPLIEIVSEPEIKSADEAIEFLKSLRSILIYSEISDCKMEQGSMRCDVNISVRELGDTKLGTKVEIKNMSSFKEVYKAIKKEEKRQIELYSYGEGHKVIQETRRWDAAKGRTLSMRTKEDAHDYRYFPEPDLPPVILKEAYVNELVNTLPELPKDKKARMVNEYKLTEKEIEIIVEEKEIAEYYENVVSLCNDPKQASNWIITEILRLMKESNVIPIKASYLAELIKETKKGTISRTAAKEVFEELAITDKDVKEIIKEKGLEQNSDTTQLESIVDDILSSHPGAIKDYKDGKKQSFGFLMGQIMKATKGTANPGMVKKILGNKLIKYY